MSVTLSGLIGLGLVIALGVLLARVFSYVLLALCVLAESLCREWWRMRRERQMKREAQ